MKKIIIVVVLLIVGYFVAYFSSVKEVTIKVTDKERIVENHGSSGVDSKYLVFTEDMEYENTDALFFGKFKSSTLQGKLKVGETYKVKVVGWRIGFLSMYPNIIKIIN